MPQHDVAALDELTEGDIHPIEVDGTSVLLTRAGDAGLRRERHLSTRRGAAGRGRS